jgi:nitrogen fixation protein FixH
MLEAMIGLFIFMMFIMMTNAYMATFYKTKTSIKQISRATAIGNNKLEKLRTAEFDSIKAGRDTVDNGFIRTWTLDAAASDPGKKSVNLTVQWPVATKKHSIQLSTIIAK